MVRRGGRLHDAAKEVAAMAAWYYLRDGLKPANLLITKSQGTRGEKLVLIHKGSLHARLEESGGGVG